MPGLASISQSTSGFDPRSIGGCQLWFDAADYGTLTFTGGNTQVTAWKDKSINGYSLSSVGSTNPTYAATGFNGKPCINFDGSTQDMNGPATAINFTTLFPTNGGNTVFMVYNQTGGTCGGIWFQWTGQASGNSHGIQTSSGNNLIFAINGLNNTISNALSQPLLVSWVTRVGNGSSTNDTMDQYCYCAAGGTVATYLNQSPSGGTYTWNYSEKFVIGAKDVNHNYRASGSHCEYIVYNQALTTQQRQAVEGYLAWKWGLQTDTSTFIPTSISGCQLWLDGADQSTNSMTLSGTSVSLWKDKTGNSTMTLGGTAPTLSTGPTGVYFPGTGYYSTTYTASPSSETLFIVFNTNASLYTGYAPMIGCSATSSRSFSLQNGSAILGYVSEAVAWGVTTTFSIGTLTLAEGTYTGSTENVTINGGLIVSGSQSFTAGRTSIIGYSNGSYFKGWLYEIIAYNSVLSTSNRQKVEAYLAKKWGVCVPTNVFITPHPFVASIPYTRYFNPIDIPGIVIWADASRLTSLSGSWPNLAYGSSYTISCGGTLNVKGRNGLNTVLLTTGQTWTISSLLSLSAYTIFWSGRQTGGANTRVLQDTTINALFGYWGGYKKDLYVINVANTAGQPGYLTGAAADTNWDMFSHARVAGGNSFMNWNGSSLYSDTGTTTNILYGLAINTGAAPAETSNCEIGEIIVYNSYLDTASILEVEGYLAQKWGLTYFNTSHTFYKYPPSTAVPFLPNNLSNCAIWLDAADKSTITASGTSLTSWLNKGTLGATAVQNAGTTTTNAATYNGNNIIQFAASTQLKITLAIPNQPRAWFAVFRQTYQLNATNPYFQIFGAFTYGYDQISGPEYNSGTGGYNMDEYRNSITGMVDTTSATNGYNVFKIYNWINSAASTSSNRIAINGTSLALTAGSSLAAGYATSSIAYVIMNGYLPSADIAELILINNEITTAQIQKIEGYLAWKWGLAASLPSTHPHRLYPPAQESIVPVVAPGAPTLNAPTNTTTTLNMSWTAGSGGTPVTYTVYVYAAGVLVTGSGGTQTISYPTTSTTFSPMISGTAYTFYVSATNSGGTSATAGPSSSVTYTAPSGGTVITTVGAGSVSFGTGTQIIIECWGGGGGSMGNDSYTGAGAGGAYAKTTISVSGSFTMYYSVGSGGTGSQTSGSAGGSTWANISANSSPSSTSQGALAAGGAGSGVAGPNNSSQSAGSIGNTVYIGGYGGYSGPENGGGGSASSAGNGNPGTSGSGTAGGSSGTNGGAGGAGGGGSYSGQDGFSNVEGGGGGGGSYNNAGGNGGAPGGAGGMGWSVQNTASPGPNTNSHGYGGNGGRGQIRYSRT